MAVNHSGRSEPFTLRLRFHGDLSFFVRPNRDAAEIVRQLQEKTSVKDAIEACGVPHPEIDLILVHGTPVDFSYPLEVDAEIEVHPVPAPPGLFPQSRLQRRNVQRFIADGHLGKLVRDLRLVGIDVLYDPAATDAELVAVAGTKERALLTRDRRLLMHAAVRDGYYPRSQLPEEQTVEVLRRFQLRSALAPHTRCLRCNGRLESVAKADVLEKLEPLTKIYYEDFRRCISCGQVYWAGSHFEKLRQRIERLLGE